MIDKSGQISLKIFQNPDIPGQNWERIFNGREFVSEFVDFEHAESCSFNRCESTVLILFAVPMPNSFARLVKSFGRLGCVSPVLAVIPAEAEQEFAHSEGMAGALAAVDDFALWPAHPEELCCRVRRLAMAAHGSLEDQILEHFSITKLVGKDPAFLRSISNLPSFARSKAPVLITGETGTGKELCARALHQMSDRRNGPFIAVDCGALPDRLFENEIFGHVRGAYTDAHQEQKGLALLADKGTLFLDEIHSLSPTSQNKLLRFIQEKTLRPLGSDRLLKSDTKIVTGTNRRLDAMVANNEFRSDLLFRIDVLRIALPALRERPSDIEILANHIVSSLNSRESDSAGKYKTLSPSSLRKLSLYNWPGNVRELQNVLERAMVLCDGRQILPAHISLGADMPLPDRLPPPTEKLRVARARWIAEFEYEYVERLIRKHRGNVTAAALEAGKERRAFGRLLQKYDIPKSA